MYSNEKNPGINIKDIIVKAIFLVIFALLIVWLFPKVPNMSAWVMRAKDFNWWYPTSNIQCQLMTDLPLFSTDPDPLFLINFLYPRDELVLVVASDVKIPFTLEQVEEINKTWNKFYESKNKET